MELTLRNARWDACRQEPFDVAILGGGINGACLYHRLCGQGRRVLLVEQGDFAGGTSQASAMMIWGGLLYLKTLDIRTVWRLCASRDRMAREMAEWVRTDRFRYVAIRDGNNSPWFVHAALGLYWLLGACRREAPRRRRTFPECEFLRPGCWKTSLTYEEALVGPSDARFVLQWILPHGDLDRVALNYCRFDEGRYDSGDGTWHLELSDRLGEKRVVARARWIVNAAGVWTDEINGRTGIQSPYKHVLSKGVFIGIDRPEGHQSPLMFDTRENNDCMTLSPWGPVALWGPTETETDLRSGFSVTPEDLRYLLAELNRHLAKAVGPEDILSLRCGVRPLAVGCGYSGGRHTLALTRRHFVHKDRHRPWISVYGGKLTGCVHLAGKVARLLGKDRLGPSRRLAPPLNDADCRSTDKFPGLSEIFPSAKWCAEREACWTLEDYLRRRTNIAQWVPRAGLGRSGENRECLLELAQTFSGDSGRTPEQIVAAYERQVKKEFDEVLARC